ncbi:uncharacterized protein LOC134691048 isoform X2 [Mytilus trossulus]
MKQPSMSERNRMILRILMARPYSTFETFTEELINFEQSKMALVSKLSNYDCHGGIRLPSVSTMDINNHTIQLQKNFKILVHQLATAESIGDDLISAEILCQEDYAEICAQFTKEQRNRLLLTKLMRKDADAFTCFLSVLKEDTSYEELARRIERTEVTNEDKILLQVGRKAAKEKNENTRGIQQCVETENIIPKNIQDQHTVLIEQWRTENKTFVSTRAAEEVLKRIRNNISVIVSGNSGVGKTATMRHVALLLQNEGYRIIPTSNPEDLRSFAQKGIKTLFVIDDICGHYTLKEQQVDKWEAILAEIQPFLEQNQCKIVATCRLQVFKDDKFRTLSLFNVCECNLNSEGINLTQEERQKLADMYFKTRAVEVKGRFDQFDFFPLLCKLYQKSNYNDINNFFNNPFEFYRNEFERLLIEDERGRLKYCCLVLCVIFNNRFDENKLKSKDTNMQDLIKDTLDACKLNKGTSVEYLKDELKTLEHTFLTNINGTYRTIHDKLFDFLAQIIGGKYADLCIKYCSTEFIRERFILKSIDTSDKDVHTNLPITLADNNIDVYLTRMIQDWSRGLVASVFGNRNMKNEAFVYKLKENLQNLDESKKQVLARNKDTQSSDYPLLLSCFIGNVSLTDWILENSNISVKNKNYRKFVTHMKSKISEYQNINMRRHNNTTPLYVACENGHLQLLKKLLYYGADVSLRKKSGDSPLSAACENGHTSVVRELLAHSNVNKDDQNMKGYSPLYLACQNGHEKIVTILLQYDADCNLRSDLVSSPLFVASENGDLSIVETLLKHGASVNIQNSFGQVPLHAACYQNHLEIVRVLLDKDSTSGSLNHLDKKNMSPLYTACQCIEGHFDIMELLLKKNADVNIGKQPLIMTCENGCTKMSKALIEHHANVNSCADDGVSPLFMACQNCHFEDVCLLLKSGADPNQCHQNGASPLVVASQNGNLQIVKKLLKHGCSINKCTDDGASPLYLASQNGHFDVVCQLIEAKAYLNRQDSDGKTAIFKASQNGHLKIVTKLVKSKADINLCMENNGDTPVEIAKKNNHSDIEIFLKKNERLSVRKQFV